MKNLLNNVMASIIAVILSTIVGLLLQVLGLSTQLSISLALFALVVLFLVFGKFYPVSGRWLTLKLLEQALSVGLNDKDQTKVNFKKKIVEQVLQQSSDVSVKQNNLITVFANQASCEPTLVNEFRNARKIKILTIRGEKYFLGHRSLFHDLCFLKRGSGFIIRVLVLSPNARHITDELAERLEQSSMKEIQLKMQLVFEHLKTMSQEQKNFEVKCYDETPIFKILLFDEVMFVSSYVQAKNDDQVKMFRITQEGNPLFTGLEKFFDDLWQKSQV
jgi:hypothetical protein